MNYARHFTASVEAGTAAAHYFLNKDGTVSTTTYGTQSAIVKEQVLGEAIERTLKDCGLSNCKYYGMVNNKPVSYMCLDDTSGGKPGFYIKVVNSYIYFMTGYNNGNDFKLCNAVPTSNDQTSYTGVRASKSPFSTTTLAANQLDTYIKVTGDTASAFNLYVMQYGTTDTIVASINVMNLVDKRNNRGILGMYFNRPELDNTAPFYKDNGNQGIFDSATIGIFSAFFYNSQYTPVNNYIILINQFAEQYPHIWCVDGYPKPSTFTTGSFYEVDGDVYYCGTVSMFKCTTAVNPG